MSSDIKILVLAIVLFIIFISCSDDKNSPNDPGNNAPEIQSITANPSPLKINETTTLNCDATDEDGDNLNYSWTADKGSFPNGKTGSSLKWKAPGTVGTYPITAKVDDGSENDSDIINVSVTEGISGGGVPCPGTPTVTYAGQIYNTVQIGNQCWLKENLNVGTMIAGSEYPTDNSIIEKYCYANNEVNCNTYGALYRWDEAIKYISTEGSQGICPEGWHIPTLEEFETLVSTVDTNGNALKAVGQGDGDGAGTNTSGFSAMLAGYKSGASGTFIFQDSYAIIWCSTKEEYFKYALSLNKYRGDVNIVPDLGSRGYSVRCIKDL